MKEKELRRNLAVFPNRQRYEIDRLNGSADSLL